MWAGKPVAQAPDFAWVHSPVCLFRFASFRSVRFTLVERLADTSLRAQWNVMFKAMLPITLTKRFSKQACSVAALLEAAPAVLTALCQDRRAAKPMSGLGYF